ncbi:MAG: thiol peroxidase [Chlamydiia bacterium]|nr:thiol peroxidase [Chlamydiia bacterium]
MDVTLKGTLCHTNGTLPAIGSRAPDFTLVDKDLKEKSLADFPGKKMIATVPSLDTGVCLASAKTFNEKVKAFTLLYVSADLPFAAARVCKAEGLNHVHTLSTMRHKNFAIDYGVFLIDGPLQGLCARSIIALDENNQVLYTELVPEITQEPNYEAALNALS